MIDADKLYSMTIVPRAERIYKDILMLIQRQMIQTARAGKTTYVYYARRELPLETEYNMIDCIYYLYNELKKYRYHVLFVKPDMLIIDWSNRNAESERDKEAFLDWEHERSMKTLRDELTPNSKKIDAIIDEMMGRN